MNEFQYKNIAATEGILGKEKEMLMEVLNKYDFEVIDIFKARSAYKVTTPKGNICLKRMKHGDHKVLNGYILVENLMTNGFNYLAKYFKTKDGNLLVKHKKFIFYVTEWIDGAECELNDVTEAANCAKFLAEFHNSSQKIDTRKLKINNNLKNWPKIFLKSLNDMENYKKIIAKKKIRSLFDITYEKHLENFYARGMTALNLLNNSEYYKLSKLAEENKTICHDSFYYQNIIKKDSKYYLIDLDSIIIDLHINDLGKLIRRLMFKSDYKWDFNKAKIIIDAYNSINPLDKENLEAMIALIIFPHKFWKLGKKRYVKCNTWSEAKYMHKLNRLIKYDQVQEKFLNDYLNYLYNSKVLKDLQI